MIQSTPGTGAFGLFGVVFILMVLSSGVAHAEKGAKWRVNGTDVGALAPKLGIAIENKSASLSFTTKGGTGVLVLCTAVEFTEGGALIAEGGISLGRVKGRGCVLLLNEAPAPKCPPRSPGLPSGEILSEKFKGLIVLDGGNDLVKLTLDTGKTYLSIELGETCAIGEQVGVETSELGGGIWLADGAGNAGFLTEAVTHLLVEGLTQLLALGQPAKTIGSATLTLIGLDTGLKWSGVPG
jgi:hypothetical protein